MISHILEGADVKPVDRISEIKVPETVAEQSGITGYVFSDKLLKLTGLDKIDIPDAVIAGNEIFQFTELAKAIAFDSKGSPIISQNWIKIWIDDQSPYAGSRTDHIWMYFGRTHKLKLWGNPQQGFPQGCTHKLKLWGNPQQGFPQG